MHLTETASLLTTFNTHLGRYRFLRVPFGLKKSQDIFQMQMDDIVAQCPAVSAIHDDVFIYSKDDRDHNANIINLFNVAQKEGLVFKSIKGSIKQDSVTFFGGVFSANGYSPDPDKSQGITEMTTPQTKQELQSFLGAVNYLQTFIPHLSHHKELLRVLLKKENTFAWDVNSNVSFQKIKSLLQKALLKPLKYYDWNKPVTLQYDALTQGTRRVHHTGWTAHSVCKQIPHWDGDLVHEHWERTPSHHVWLWEVPHICIWQNIHHWNRPQTAGNDQPEEPYHSPGKATEDAPSTTAVWHGYYIQTRQGDAPGWCPQPSPITDRHRDQAWPLSQCHIDVSLHEELPDKDHSWDTMRSNPIDSLQIDTGWLALQMHTCTQSSQELLGLLRWTLH